MNTVNFSKGVSGQVVETMVGEVMDSMIFHGEIPIDMENHFAPDGETIIELCKIIAAKLNEKCAVSRAGSSSAHLAR